MKKAGDLLKDFFDNISLRRKEGETVFSSWDKIAGYDIAGHSRITELKKNVLTIEADHPGWIQIINMKKRQILEKVNEKFPEKEISEIRVVLRKAKKN